METLSISNYLMLVKDAHEKRGRIGGQRDVLKTTTGKRIRDRMIADIRAGAVLPPVVVGIVDSPSSVEGVVAAKDMSVEDFIRGLRGESL